MNAGRWVLLSRLWLLRGLLAAGAALPATVHALVSDRAQPVKVSADRVEINQKTGHSEYRGNVTLVQGSLRIRADFVRVTNAGRDIVSVHASGKPVTFHQKLDGDKGEVDASALKVTYFAREGRVDLHDKVSFRRGGDVFDTQVLRYYLESGHMNAAGGKPGERVRSVLTPKRKDTIPAPTTAAPVPSGLAPATPANPPAPSP